MNLRTLRKEFGKRAAVSRDRRKREVTVSAAGLGYRADESRFGSERELAEHLKSKLPALSVRPE